MTRLNVITVRVKIKLTTRTLSEDFLGRLVWEHLDFDKTKSPTEVWGDHRERGWMWVMKTGGFQVTMGVGFSPGSITIISCADTEGWSLTE
jgi:hypothetical protein